MIRFIFYSIFLSSLLSFASCLYFHIGETEKKCFIEEIPDETMVVGNYKVEMFDRNQNRYVPTIAGLGMHVEVRDPLDSIIMSRSLVICSSSWIQMQIEGHYRVQVYDEKSAQFTATVPGRLGVHVEVIDPFGSTVLARTYAAEGRFTFTSHTAGEHVICLHSNSTAWFGGGQLRVHLDIQIGEHANDYKEIAAKDKLTELQLRVRQLLDQVEMITKEQNYQRRVHLKITIDEAGYEDYKVVQDKEQLNELELRIRKLIDSTNKIKKEQDFQRYREERFRQTSESTNQRVLWWSIAQTLILLLTGFWQMRHLKGFFEAKKLV